MKKDSSYVILVMVILGITILGILSFLMKNPEVLIAIIVVAVIVAIIVAIIASSNKSAEEEAERLRIVRETEAARQRKEREAESEREKNISIINSSEPTPTLIYIPISTDFSCKEEEFINQSFRDYLKYKNELTVANEHINFLNKKISAYKHLGRAAEIGGLEQEVKEARSGLRSLQSESNKQFNSSHINTFWRIEDIEKTFSPFIENLPHENVEVISDFIKGSLVKMVKTSKGKTLVFTPCYVLFYSGVGVNIKLVKYSDFKVSSKITTDYVKLNHEYEAYKYEYDRRIHWDYENKDGKRDMRRSDNGCHIFAYKGSVTLSYQDHSFVIEFANKTDTLKYEEQVKKSIELTKSKYKKIVDLIFEHNESIATPDGLKVYLTKQAEKEKQRLEKARAEKARKELERKKAETKKLNEQREKQKREELLRTLTVTNYVVTNYYGHDKNLIIPVEIAKHIGTAFRWKTGLESVKIPDGFVTIRSNAFYGSTALHTVSIPDTVTEIGTEAFSGCTGLKNIILPNKLNSISIKLFSSCSALKTIKIPSSVETIGEKAFADCGSLSEIEISEGVTTIGDGAFENCSQLKKISLPNTIVSVGKGVFAGCSSLERVVLSDNVKEITDNCFSGLHKLISITVSPNITHIGSSAFRNCQSLKQIRLTSSYESEELTFSNIKEIGKSAFENCASFQGFVFEEGIISIGDFAFAKCKAISSVNLPKSLSNIGVGAFSGCSELEIVTGSNDADWKKKGVFNKTLWLENQAKNGFVIFDTYLETYIGSQEQVIIPDGVTVIGRCAFECNAQAVDVQIPSSTFQIDEYAFARCINMRSIQIPDSVTKIEDTAFEGCHDFIIKCSRGSAASTFRIQNKIPGEYVAKERPPQQDSNSDTRKKRKTNTNNLSGLSDEEHRLVMEMRRDRIAQRKAEQENAEPIRIEYTEIDYDAWKVVLKPSSKTKMITNNIFNIIFEQSSPVSAIAHACEYEAFFTDVNGNIISNIRIINADISDNTVLNHKTAFTLSGQDTFDKSADYYLCLRYKGDGTNVLNKTPYRINIEFTADFGF